MSELNFEILEENIRNLMRNKNITQHTLAEVAGMTQANVSKALNPSEKKRFTLDQVYRIANHYGVSIDSLVGNTAENRSSTSPRTLFLLLVKLLCNGDIRTADIKEQESQYVNYLNSHGYYDCDVKDVEIEYTAFYFPDFYKIADFANLSEQEDFDLHNYFCSVGNNTKYRMLNQILKKVFPIIKVYRNKEIPEEAFQMILNGYMEQLSE